MTKTDLGRRRFLSILLAIITAILIFALSSVVLWISCRSVGLPSPAPLVQVPKSAQQLSILSQYTSYTTRIPQVVLLATSTDQAGELVISLLRSAGIRVLQFGVRHDIVETYGPGDGAVLWTSGTPHGLPKFVPILYIAENPLLRLSWFIKYEGNATLPVESQMGGMLVAWDADNQKWLTFDKGHMSKFEMIYLEDFALQANNTVGKLMDFLNVGSEVKLFQNSEVAALQTTLLKRYQGLQPILMQLCNTFQTTSMHYPSQECYKRTCELAGAVACSPSSNLTSPASDMDITTFGDTQWDTLVSSPVRTVVRKKRVCLVTTFHLSNHTIRQQEYELALRANVHNPYIDEIHILTDSNNASVPEYIDTWKGKVYVQRLLQQPTYKQLFEYANKYLHGQVVVISNADIVYTASIDAVHAIQHQEIYALSRQMLKEVSWAGGAPGCGKQLTAPFNWCWQYIGSHDAFVFLPPVLEAALAQLQFAQNIHGAENRVIWVLSNSNYTIMNPCKTIVALHAHCSDVRTYLGKKKIVTDLSKASAKPIKLACTHHNCPGMCWQYQTQSSQLLEC